MFPSVVSFLKILKYQTLSIQLSHFFVKNIMMWILRYLQKRPLHLQNSFVSDLFTKTHLYRHTWCYRRMRCFKNNYSKTTLTIGLKPFTTLRYIVNWFLVVPICVRKLEFGGSCRKCLLHLDIALVCDLHWKYVWFAPTFYTLWMQPMFEPLKNVL